MKLYLILLMTFFAFGCGFSFNQASFYLPSDENMQNDFLKNEFEFNKLTKMFIEENSSITFIAKQKNKFYFQEKISNERWSEYQRIFEKANIRYGINRYENFGGQNPVIFPIDWEDFGGQTFKDQYDEFFTGEKGYAYSTKKLTPLVDSLDEISDEQLNGKGPLFKQINDNWYIYYKIGVRKPE